MFVGSWGGIPSLLSLPPSPSPSRLDSYNLKDFGDSGGNGRAVNSQAFERAVEAMAGQGRGRLAAQMVAHGAVQLDQPHDDVPRRRNGDPRIAIPRAAGFPHLHQLPLGGVPNLLCASALTSSSSSPGRKFRLPARFESPAQGEVVSHPARAPSAAPCPPCVQGGAAAYCSDNIDTRRQ